MAGKVNGKSKRRRAGPVQAAGNEPPEDLDAAAPARFESEVAADTKRMGIPSEDWQDAD